ncbi:ATP-binding protein [Siphonobacter aquaeclarae]|uniref:histidine kinase n=1 Tax=Siphonobacter aquaeclarae TaxID=563176 RepID=A0A1G9Q6M3_9BACT|nr:ATP-binding protein [Siphonobacter aquaeclarae]SDM06694.1 Histidine kinase-, DNA gyrase B-, and HSP90-like ATPase [Siphonobacter aquaeclarae]
MEQHVRQQTEWKVTQGLTRLYVFCLSAVAIFTLAGQILIQRSLSDLLDDAHIVNIAGRQRMLSQLLTKRSVLLAYPDRFKDTESYRKDFAEQLRLWKESHEGLRNGTLTGKKVIQVKKSAPLDSMFVRLEVHFNLMYKAFEVVEKGGQGMPEALSVILGNERAFLETMDNIVFQFDFETQKRVDRVKNIEFMLAVLTFVVLFIEGVFIFRPVVEYTGEMFRAITQSEASQKQANDQLQIVNQYLREAQEALMQSTEEKLEMQRHEARVRASSLLEGQEEERKRLARELHDGIGQMLTGIRLHIEQLQDVPFSSERQRRNYEELRQLIVETIESTRQVSFNLMPSVLYDFGVEAAIRILCERAARDSGIEVEFKSRPGRKRIPENAGIGLYRITQEALNNCLKHAKAQYVEVSLIQEKDRVRLRIHDDGKGFDLKKLKARKGSLIGSGLRNMQVRAELLGGKLQILSKTGEGTEISASLPM